MQEHGTPAKRRVGRPAGPRVTITCIVCGGTRDVKPSDAARGSKYCGKACDLADKAPTEASTHDRVWSKIKLTETTWLWTGAKNSMGYGHFMLSKNPRVDKLVSHYMWWEKTGHWPTAGEVILHTCDTTCRTPLCVRNDEPGTYEVRGRVLQRWGHLALGAPLDNNDDMIDKGRKARGEQSGTSPLTESDVLEIRAAYAAGESQTDLARRFHVHQMAIWCIVHGRTWKHVGGEIATPRRAKTLSEETVLAIRADAALGMKGVDIARTRNVSGGTVSRILSRQIWDHLP